MPQIDVKQSYTVILTAQEFRLVTMGLAGKLEDPEDVEDAIYLNLALCRQRETSLTAASNVARRALENASALDNPNIPPIKK